MRSEILRTKWTLFMREKLNIQFTRFNIFRDKIDLKYNQKFQIPTKIQLSQIKSYEKGYMKCDIAY